jgi:hypothetical protein
LTRTFFLQENHDSFMFSHYTDSNKEIICKGGFLLAEKNFLVDHLISEIKGGTFQLVDKKLPSEHSRRSI